MKFSGLFGAKEPGPDDLPGFVRQVQDIGGVRVLRLQGPVGKEIGGEVEAFDKGAARQRTFERPLLLDFSGTSGSDFSTVSYLVRALRSRMTTSVGVGIIHPLPELIAELEIAKLEPLFVVFESEEEALAALGASHE